ncbi:MAG: hypothetical protein ACOC1K_06365 [Nanoarchaeota archaeon]
MIVIDPKRIEVRFKGYTKENKSVALELPQKNDLNKIYFTATLCHALPLNFPNHNENLPLANANAETFLATSDEAPDFIKNPIGLKEAIDSVVDSSGNLFHDPDFTVGHTRDAMYIEETEDETAHIDFLGVAQRDLLNNFGIEKEHLSKGFFDISMECYFTEWFYIWGNKIIKKEDMPELEDYVGKTYKNLGVICVIADPNFSAWGLIESGFQADELANIKSVASKSKRKSMLSEPRRLNYKNLEESSWDRPTVDECVKGYYAQNEGAKPDSEEEIPGKVSDMPQPMKDWIAQLSFLGDPNTDTFDDLLILPAVNPLSFALNKNALDAVIQTAKMVEGIDNDTANRTQEMAQDLLEIEFNESSEGGKDMFKELKFETEEDYNKFIDEVKEGYVSVASVDEKFNDLELEEKDNLDKVVNSVAEVINKYKELQKNIERAELFNERVAKLAEANVNFDELDIEKEELIEMNEVSFNVVLKTATKAAAKAKADKDDKDKKFNPNFNIEDGKFDFERISKALQ